MLLIVFWVLSVKSERDCLKSLSDMLCDKSFALKRAMSDHLVSCAVSAMEELTPVRHKLALIIYWTAPSGSASPLKAFPGGLNKRATWVSQRKEHLRFRTLWSHIWSLCKRLRKSISSKYILLPRQSWTVGLVTWEPSYLVFRMSRAPCLLSRKKFSLFF